MKIERNTKFIESYLQHRLHPNITVERITDALPGITDALESGDGKAQHYWSFLASGRECAIWDMRGMRWSAYGPREVFDALGLEVIGGVNDVELAMRLNAAARS